MTQTKYKTSDLLRMDACTNCTVCADVCPAVRATEDGKLSGVYRISQLRKILRSRSGLFRRFFGCKEPTLEELKVFSNTVYSCTLCGRCEASCPSGISLRDLWLSLREDMVENKVHPKKVDMILSNVQRSHNVFDEENEERADWVEDMNDPPDHGYLKDQAEVVYFTGCVSAYFPMAQQIPIALAEIFEAASVDFTLMGEQEWCCGFPLLGAGLRSHFQDLIDHNIQAVKEKGATTIVFSCPSCYQMWKEHYPKEFKMFHVTQYMDHLISTSRLNLNRLEKTVTFHDPCDLGRGGKEFDAPRRIINAIPGLILKEMAHNREDCICCGGGGNLEMIDKSISAAIAEEKINEVLNTGAQSVVTACQQCVRTMNTHVMRNKIKIQVQDIVQLVHEAI